VSTTTSATTKPTLTWDDFFTSKISDAALQELADAASESTN